MLFFVTDVMSLWWWPYCCWCCATVVDETNLLWLMFSSYWCKTILQCFAISDITIANVNGWWFCHCGWCYCHYCFFLYCGRCNNHLLLADVIAKCVVADVIAKYMMAGVVAICGRWNIHFMWWADVIALWQMEWPHGWNVGRSYCLGGRWNNHWVNYFNFVLCC